MACLAAAEAGEATEGPINYEVYAAPFADGSLGERVLISDPWLRAKEQDPMFSPDGESIVYGAQLTEDVPGAVRRFPGRPERPTEDQPATDAGRLLGSPGVVWSVTRGLMPSTPRGCCRPPR